MQPNASAHSTLSRPLPRPRSLFAALSLLLSLALSLLSACGQQSEEKGQQQNEPKSDRKSTGAASVPSGKINVYMFSEYIDPAMLEEFKQQTGVEIRLDVYEADEEMLAKMQGAGGVSQYDVVVVSNYIIPIMANLNLLQPLDPALIPNRANVDEPFVNPPYDPGNKYSLPYQWGTVGFFYRTDKVPQQDGQPVFDATWQTLFDESKQPGPFVMMDEMRSMMSASLIAVGASVNTRDAAQVKAAGELLLKAKSSRKCLGFDGGVAGKNKVVAGDAVMAVVYNGDAVRGMEEEQNARFVLPREGGTMWVDSMVIPAKAPNAAGAHAFINYILDAKAGAQLSNFNRYATPNKASLPLIAPKDRANPAIYPTDEQMQKLYYVEDMGQTMPLYDEVWTMVKSR